MASLVLGAAGAYVGSMFGMGSLGWSIGSSLGSMFDKVDSKTVYGPKVSDLKIQTSTYGNTIPTLFGSTRVAGNVIWMADIVEHEHRSTSGGGGKGGDGGGEVTTISYTYTVSVAISICVGPVHGVLRIWAGGELIYETTSVAGLSANKATAGFKIYDGGESQLPDPTVESILGVGNAPAYRGQAYIVFTDLDVTKYGAQLPNFTFEVVSLGTSAPSTVICTGGGTPTAPYSVGVVGGSVMAGLYTNVADAPYTHVFWDYYYVDSLGNYSDTTRVWVCSYLTAGPPYFVSSVKRAPNIFFVMVGYTGADYAWVVDGKLSATLPTAQFSPSLGGGLPTDCFYVGGFVILASAGASGICYPGSPPHASIAKQIIGAVADENGNIFVRYSVGGIYRVSSSLVELEGPWTENFSVSVDFFGKQGNDWYFSDTYYSGTLRVHRVPDSGTYFIDQYVRTELSISGGYITALAGDGLVVMHTPSGWEWLTLLPLPSASAQSLGGCITSLCSRVSLGGGDIDVSQISDSLSGYTIANKTSCRAGIQPLMDAFQIEAFESSGKVKFVKRGGASVVTIPSADSIQGDDGG